MAAPKIISWDKIFKAVLANPVCIRQMLETYVCREDIFADINFDKMEQLSTEFIDPYTQRSYYGDMLWRIQYKDPQRNPLYLVLLLELQSSNCQYMALRMNNYMTQFYFRLLKTTPAKEAFPLPQVLPVVFYTGWKSWKSPLDACELIDNNGAGLWSPEPLFRFRYKLLDILRLANITKRNSPLWLLVDCLQTNEVDKLIEKWHNLKCVLPGSMHPLYNDAWATLFGMVMDNISEGKMNAKSSLKTEYRQYTMEELDERFDAEGNMIDWRQRFLDQGQAEGKKEERLSILRQVLHGKNDVISAAQLAKVLEHRDEPDLFTRIIKANTVDELLQSLC